MVGASGGERGRPLREVRGKEGAGKSKIYDARAPNERHGKPSKHARKVKESEPQVCSPVEVGGSGGNLVLLENPKGVCSGVVDI